MESKEAELTEIEHKMLIAGSWMREKFGVVGQMELTPSCKTNKSHLFNV